MAPLEGGAAAPAAVPADGATPMAAPAAAAPAEPVIDNWVEVWLLRRCCNCLERLCPAVCSHSDTFAAMLQRFLNHGGCCFSQHQCHMPA